jgi:hypothetical protein
MNCAVDYQMSVWPLYKDVPISLAELYDASS